MEGTSDFGLLGENFDGGFLGRMKDSDYESRSGSDNFDGLSGDDQDTGEEQPRGRKKYHRHTPQQIQELEAFFKECPHPDEKQRTDLSRKLGLENKQVKFWFQNRRTQMKTQLERHENMMLRQENEKLRAENSVMKEAMANPMCNSCGGPAIPGQVSFEEHQVRIENARLKDELNRICILANKFIGRQLSPLVSPMALQSPSSGLDLAIGMNGIGGSSNLGMPLPLGLDSGDGILGTPPPMSGNRSPMGLMGNQIQLDRSALIDLALAAMDELFKMAQPDSPLWIKRSDGMKDVLNHDEYARMVPPCLGPKPNGYVTDATRETGTIIGNSLAVLEILMDPERWLEMFPSLVARAVTLEVISGGMGGTRNGALQVMHAEVQLPTPLVPVRQLSFLRFCKQHAEGLWAVVDVSIDIGHNANNANPFMSCRRLPSGCVVQDTSNGLSKVTWIEHCQYDERVVHELYRPLVNAGIGYGAQRWVASLQRQYECLSILMSASIPSEDSTGLSQSGKRSMVKVAQRIANNFFSGICASSAHMWEPIHIDNLSDNMKIMARKSGAGEPSGIVLSVATSVWLPVPQQRLFDFLRDERARGQWDVLASSEPMHELFHISKGQGRGNCVSVFRRAANGPENHMLVLQDSWTDNSCSAVVYVPIDMESLNMMMSGGDSAYIGLLPSGFVILPDGRGHSNNYFNGSNSSSGGRSSGGDGGGSMLTVGLQILLNTLSNANKLTVDSVLSVNNLISETIQKIKDALRVA